MAFITYLTDMELNISSSTCQVKHTKKYVYFSGTLDVSGQSSYLPLTVKLRSTQNTDGPAPLLG